MLVFYVECVVGWNNEGIRSKVNRETSVGERHPSKTRLIPSCLKGSITRQHFAVKRHTLYYTALHPAQPSLNTAADLKCNGWLVRHRFGCCCCFGFLNINICFHLYIQQTAMLCKWTLCVIPVTFFNLKRCTLSHLSVHQLPVLFFWAIFRYTFFT